MKKSLILFSLLCSLGVLAESEASEDQTFVVKGLSALHKKCAHAKAKFEATQEAKIHWEAVKKDCASLPNIPEARIADDEMPSEAAPTPETPILEADLPKTDL